MAKNRQMYFMSFAVETTSGWGPLARADSIFISLYIMKNLRETIAIAIQQGNAATMSSRQESSHLKNAR